MPWKARRPNQIEKENDQLRTVVIQLRSELETRANAVRRLEILARARSTRIDNLTGTVDRLREQNRRLDAEADRLAEMIRLSP
jgi:hypothetical protein